MLDAELLLHVVDGSDVNPMAQIEAVHQVIREVQAEHHAPPAPELLVVNKIDAASELTLTQLRRALPGAIFVSARTGEGLDRLRTRLGELVEPREIAVDVTIPYKRGDLIARLHGEGRVDATEHTESGTRVKARVPAALAAAVAQYVTA